jgi:hypothetical protein
MGFAAYFGARTVEVNFSGAGVSADKRSETKAKRDNHIHTDEKRLTVSILHTHMEHS